MWRKRGRSRGFRRRRYGFRRRNGRYGRRSSRARYYRYQRIINAGREKIRSHISANAFCNDSGGFTTITDFTRATNTGVHSESHDGPLRDGYKIMPVSVRLRGFLVIQNNSAEPPEPQAAFVRLILLRCKTSTVPALNQVLDFGVPGNASTQVPYNRRYANQWFKILVDRRYLIDRDHRQVLIDWKFKRGMRPITYTGDLPSSASKGELVFYWMSNIASLVSGQPVLGYYWTVTATNV